VPPDCFVKPGDTLAVESPRIGVLHNKVVTGSRGNQEVARATPGSRPSSTNTLCQKIGWAQGRTARANHSRPSEGRLSTKPSAAVRLVTQRYVAQIRLALRLSM
jgi:hypothetical protein